ELAPTRRAFPCRPGPDGPCVTAEADEHGGCGGDEDERAPRLEPLHRRAEALAAGDGTSLEHGEREPRRVVEGSPCRHAEECRACPPHAAHAEVSEHGPDEQDHQTT